MMQNETDKEIVDCRIEAKSNAASGECSELIQKSTNLSKIGKKRKRTRPSCHNRQTAHATKKGQVSRIGNPGNAALTEGKDESTGDSLSSRDPSTAIKAFLTGRINESHPLFEQVDIPSFVQCPPFNLTFPQKLMLMLAHAERCRPCTKHSDSEKSSGECRSNKACISWVGQGKAIEINDRDDFLQSLVPLFFDTKKIKFVSFVRKLNRWGFRRTDAASAGSSSSSLGEYHSRAVFSHPFFDRENRHLVHKMRCITTMSTADILHRHQEENPDTADLPASKQDPDDEDESSSVRSRTCSPLSALTTTTGKAGEGSSHCGSPGSFSQQDFSTVSLRHCNVPVTAAGAGAGGAQSSVPVQHAAARSHPVNLQRVLSDPIRYAGLTSQNVAGGLNRPHGLSSGLPPMTMMDPAESRSLSVPSNLDLLQNRLLQSQRMQHNSLIPLIQRHSSSLLGPVTGQRHNYSAAASLLGADDRRNTLVDQLVASRRVAVSDNHNNNNTDIFNSVVRTLPDASMNLQWQNSQNRSLLPQSHDAAASPWTQQQQQQQQQSSLVTAAAAASLARRQELQSFRDLQQQLRHAAAHGLAVSETRPATDAAAARAAAAAFQAYAAAERGTPRGPFANDQHSLEE